MKAKEARERGYTDTGVSDLGIRSNFDERRKEFKAKGYKTVIVNERVDKYSRSCPGMAYRSLYVEKRYKTDRTREDLERKIASETAKKAFALGEYEKAIAKIDEEMAVAKERLAKLNAEIEVK